MTQPHTSPPDTRPGAPPATTADGADPSGEPRPGEVVATVAQLVGEVIGEEYVADLDIGPDTSFSDDLEMESIEFVALAEALQLRFGERVDFVAWLAELELDDLIDMTVGRVAAFIEDCLSR